MSILCPFESAGGVSPMAIVVEEAPRVHAGRGAVSSGEEEKIKDFLPVKQGLN